MVVAAIPANLKPISQINLPGKRHGRRMHINSIHRLILHGVTSPSGELVRLRAWKLSGVWMTDDRSVAEFLEAMRSDGCGSSEHRVEDADAVGRKLELLGC